MHPAVAKANKIGNLAVKHDWTGKLDSQMVSNRRITTLSLNRESEHLIITWTRNDITSAVYHIHGTKLDLKTNRQLHLAITQPCRPKLHEVIDNNFSPDLIIANLVGRDIFWWDSIEPCVRHDHVLYNQNAKCKIMPVGHRKMFQFMGAQAGQRNVMLDMILKVV